MDRMLERRDIGVAFGAAKAVNGVIDACLGDTP